MCSLGDRGCRDASPAASLLTTKKSAQHTFRVSQERAHDLEVLGLFVADARYAIGRELIYPRVRIRHQNRRMSCDDELRLIEHQVMKPCECSELPLWR